MKTSRFTALALLFFALVLFAPILANAKYVWLQVRSKNFLLIGNASEKEIRKVATKMEQFRETFRQVFRTMNLNAAIPTNVIVFKSDSAFKPFKPKRADGKTDNFLAGFFQPGEDVNYIAVSTEGEDADTYGTIFHEYVHFIIETNFGKSDVPPWFNEGLAEYYQTFAIEQDQKVKLGLPQSVHLDLLRQSQLIPLDTFFKINHYSLTQNGNHSRSIFYAQAWALIHYLVQSGKTEGLGSFMSRLMQNVPPQQAFQEAFQTTYADMEKGLRKYVGQSTYQYHLLTFKDKLLFDTQMQASPLTDADSNAYLGDLLYHTNRADDAEPYLRTALAAKPDSSMANTTLGMVKLNQRKFDEAKTYLEKAIYEDQKNHLALYRYAYLLSREDRDEFGYVQSFPAERAAKMLELLKKSIAINPAFAANYELLAFVNLVNNENFDESIAYLKQALKYQPGNQRYAIGIAEIYVRQEKYKEAAEIAGKIATTADEPDIKTQAENLLNQIRQREEFAARNEAARKEYEAAAGRNGQPMTIRQRPGEKPMTAEEMKKAEEEAAIRSINGALRKPLDGETQVLGTIQKIDCKPKGVSYYVKTDTETFTLTSKDFQNLTLTAFVPEADSATVGCDAKIAAIRSVLTFKPNTAPPRLLVKGAEPNKGELIAIDFVPGNFRFMDVPDETTLPDEVIAEEDAPAPASSASGADPEAQRRAAMMAAMKNAMRKPLDGEKQALGFIDRTECDKKGVNFFIKSGMESLKLFTTSPQNIQIRAFVPDLSGVQFGCGMKSIDIPVVFTYKAVPDTKSKTAGELVSLEFVPKSFTLEK